MAALVDCSAIVMHVSGVALTTQDVTGGRVGLHGAGGRDGFTGVSVGTVAEAYGARGAATRAT